MYKKLMVVLMVLCGVSTGLFAMHNHVKCAQQWRRLFFKDHSQELLAALVECLGDGVASVAHEHECAKMAFLVKEGTRVCKKMGGYGVFNIIAHLHNDCKLPYNGCVAGLIDYGIGKIKVFKDLERDYGAKGGLVLSGVKCTSSIVLATMLRDIFCTQ